MNLNPVVSLIITAVFSALVFLNGYVNMRTAEYSIVPLFWIISVGLIIGWMNISRIADEKLGNVFLVDKLIGEMKFIGRNLIVYLCLNQVTILILNKIFTKIGFYQNIFAAVIILIITLIILHFTYILFDKTKLRVMFVKF